LRALRPQRRQAKQHINSRQIKFQRCHRSGQLICEIRSRNSSRRFPPQSCKDCLLMPQSRVAAVLCPIEQHRLVLADMHRRSNAGACINPGSEHRKFALARAAHIVSR
jgi:hypothetical protein